MGMNGKALIASHVRLQTVADLPAKVQNTSGWWFSVYLE